MKNQLGQSSAIYFACKTPFRRRICCRGTGCNRVPLHAMGNRHSRLQQGRTASIPGYGELSYLPWQEANSTPVTAQAQLSGDLAHQDCDTRFTRPAARRAPEHKAASLEFLLHCGEHLSALEVLVVVLWTCHTRKQK